MIRPLRFLGEYFLGTEAGKYYRYERQVMKEFAGSEVEKAKELKDSRRREMIYRIMGKAIPNGILGASVLAWAISDYPPYGLIVSEPARWLAMYEERKIRKLDNQYRSQIIELSENKQKIDELKRQLEDEEGDEWKQ